MSKILATKNIKYLAWEWKDREMGSMTVNTEAPRLLRGVKKTITGCVNKDKINKWNYTCKEREGLMPQ